MKKVVVFSDSHSGLSFMRRAIHVLKPNAFIHLGDHYDDGAVIAEENPGIPNYIVQGNCDWSLCFSEPEQMCLKVFGVLMLLTHGHRYGVKAGTGKLEAYARSQGAQAALYGHTHRADCRQEGDLWVLNPGTCSHYGGSVGLMLIENNQIVDCRIITGEELTELGR